MLKASLNVIARFLIVSAFTFFITTPVLAMPAFPGAQGFGSESVGGRGGKVIEVTNLNDSGPGSLRDAVETQSGPRIVVFTVGGVIQANSVIYVKNPFITIAGQTAPGNGIVVKGSPFFIRTHDVIIRGMKMRIGDQAGAKSSDRDGITVWGDSSHQVYNVIVDHNSITWAVDENTSVYDESNNANTVTFSWNIIAEALYCSIHLDEDGTTGCHSMGMLIQSPKGNISVHHNLFASNNDRNPAIQGGNVEVVNNVIYNWGIHGTKISGGNLHALGNTYLNTSNSSKWVGPGVTGIHCEGSPGKIYAQGNVGPGGADWSTVACTGSLASSVKSTAPVFTGSGVSISSAEQSYTDIMDRAGAKRDAIDSRILGYVSSRSKPTSSKWILDGQGEVGGNWDLYQSAVRNDDADKDGMADSWEQANGGNLSPTATAPSGYTWVEEYINSFFPVSGIATQVVTAPVTPKLGDANASSTVDEEDYLVWKNTYLTKPLSSGVQNGDFNKDGIVDGVDYMIWINNYGK
ncbi:hypothetical protein KBD75_00885 [Candidatus Woesebacteria bacterium]|nr:hypothetical protein [Candidatus Woesebacteria bacterium]